MAKQPWNRFDTAREFGDTCRRRRATSRSRLFDPSRTQPRIQTAAESTREGGLPVCRRDRRRARGRRQHRSADHPAPDADRPDRPTADRSLNCSRAPGRATRRTKIRSRFRSSRRSSTSIPRTSARSVSRARSTIGAATGRSRSGFSWRSSTSTTTPTVTRARRCRTRSCCARRTRAPSKLLKEIELEEQEYVRLRRRKPRSIRPR